LGLSYSNARSMHSVIDTIPARAKWKSKYLSFPDTPGSKHLVQYRDPIEAICSLLGNPAHAQDIDYVPRKVFTNSNKEERIYHEMWTGKWWYTLQQHLPIGSSIAPVIISTDKTQLTQFSGSKSAYPVYLTLGNIPRAIRRKPSQHACILIGYLSVDKIISNKLSKKEKSIRMQRLFHDSMRLILEPLKEAGRTGVEMTGGDGKIRRIFPVLACYIADYPEQCLITCAKYGTCPKCQCSAEDLSDSTPGEPRTSNWTNSVISEALQES
ncbi:hypothetical protein BJ138DRAFT_968054, partial [Hygrophoropsis aurantiaca]